MAATKHLRQRPDEPILVRQWAKNEDFPVFPVGSKPKRMLTCPQEETRPYLIPGHSYLFKTALGWQAQQVWSEVVAYHVGRMAGLDVPPCFVALDEETGTTGALAEFFYGYPSDDSPARLIHASDLMTRILADKKRGRPHGVRMNLLLCRLLKVNEPVRWWARVLAFDALIGNTDRHPENWGILVRRTAGGVAIEYEMAPPFDNGTSLGYEQLEASLTRLLNPARLNAYIEKGTHHCGWDVVEDAPAHHIQLCVRFAAAYPEAGIEMQSVIRFDDDELAAVLDECTRFDVSLQFTADRAAFVSELIRTRRARLLAALGG